MFSLRSAHIPCHRPARPGDPVNTDREYWIARSSRAMTPMPLDACSTRLPRLRRGRMAAHVVEHRGARPAIELEAVRLLVGAERGARFHAGLAVDLVLVEAAGGENVLHRLDVG